MADAYDWAKDDAYMLEKFHPIMMDTEYTLWIHIERECDCGFSGLTEVLVADDDTLWCWDCPECAHEHEQPAEVLAP